ncbi:hypothetical protein [Actinokineospora pegani]|uniref:hypothetical protein n=1 Tax=Actinokineospora pegani TaxID=2654637 RepID=UPI0012EA9495|nr:hypothetical protein [Actinokineospora pegani]
MSNQRRVAVSSPQTRLAHARRRHHPARLPPTLDPAEAERAARVLRAQRRPAVRTLAGLAALLFGLPLLLWALPALVDVRLLGVPAAWLALVVVPFPVLVGLAWWHLRRAERAEDPPP